MINIKTDSKRGLLELEASGRKEVLLDEIASSVGCLLAKMADGDKKFYRYCIKQISDKMYACMQECMEAIDDPKNINIGCKNKKSVEKLDELSKFLNKWLEDEEGDDDDSEEN